MRRILFATAAAASSSTAAAAALPWDARAFDVLSPAAQNVLRAAMLPHGGEATRLRRLGVGPHSTVPGILFDENENHGDPRHHFDWWVFPLPRSRQGSAQTGHTFELETPRDYDAVWELSLTLSLNDDHSSTTCGGGKPTRPYWEWVVAAADRVIDRSGGGHGPLLSPARRFKMELCCSELAAAARRSGDALAAAELDRISRTVRLNEKRSSRL